MREAKEVEGLRLAFSSSFPVLFGIPPELDPARLFRVQLQSELPQPFSQALAKTVCVRTPLEAEDEVSRPGESHPEALAELYVSLSTHTAPIMEPRRAPICQWANNSGAQRERRAIQGVALRRWRRSFLYFCLAQRTRSRSSSRMVG